ncbi:MAG: M12 family metallo-peptidase [Planctomycetota bacterium]|nr:M12 family metallo-peptidase [Planctomycetota bacterium]
MLTARALRPLFLLFAASLGASATMAQQVRQAPPSLLAQFDVHAGSLQSISLPVSQHDRVTVSVVLAGTRYTMDVALHDVRAPNFQLLERTSAGLVPLPRPDCVTYRGSLQELPLARVAATVVDGAMEAMIYLPTTSPTQPDEVWVVQSLRRVQPAASPSLHLVYKETDSVVLPYQCGTDTTGASTTPLPGGGDFTAVCEIAIEADRQFWQWNNNSVTQTQNDVTSVMNQVDFIYDRDVDVTFTVVTIIVTTATVYTTNDSTTLLSQFSNFWNTNNGAIHRDVAHLFTGRNLTGSTIGVAYLGVICSQGNAYGLSQSDFTNNFNRRVGLTCHELGHNFSAPHCNGNNPCYIMCASLNGCSNNVTLFGPTAAAQIDGYAHNSICMPPPAAPPVLTSASPATATVFSPGGLTLQGTGLSTVDSYTVAGQTFTGGFAVQSDNQVSISIPQGTALGPTAVTVSNPLGTSNPMTLSYTLTQPPRLRSTALVPPSGGVASFDFGGVPGNQWFLLLGLSPLTSPLQGLDVLSSPLLLAGGTHAGPLGIDNFAVPVPGGLGTLQFFLQVVEGDPSGVAAGASNITTTILQ